MKQNGLVIYIQVPVDDIVTRVKDSLLRPVFRRMENSGNIKEEIKNLLSHREPFYSRADIKVSNLDVQSPELVVKRIIEKIKLLIHKDIDSRTLELKYQYENRYNHKR